jgi:cobalamin biosynthetic protein CobC
MIAGFTHHGGGIAAAMARWGDAGRLAGPVNRHQPRPWAGRVAFDWRALPDAGALAALERAAAEHFGASPTHCCALPGSELGLRLIGHILGGPATYLWPAYRTHGAAFADGVAGHDGPGRAPLLLANPNNPDGRIVPPETCAWHDTLAARGGWLVVDEAFADATPMSRSRPCGALAGPGGAALVWQVLRAGRAAAGLCAGARCCDGAAGPVGRLAAGAAALAMARPPIAIRRGGRTRGDLARRAAHGCHAGRHDLRATGQCPHFRLIRDARAPEVFAQPWPATASCRARLSMMRAGCVWVPAGGRLARLDRALAMVEGAVWARWRSMRRWAGRGCIGASAIRWACSRG